MSESVCPVAIGEASEGIRDSWCTPAWLTALLPHVDLDPCSNPRSTVRARMTYSLEAGQDGLALPWFGTVYVNGPYSNLLPWANRLVHGIGTGHVKSAGFLVNADPSTKWWAVLTGALESVLLFSKRIRFEPPPGVPTSSNSRPQALIANEAFLDMCEPGLFTHGVVYTRSRARKAV